MGKSKTSSYIVEYRLAFNDENPMSVLQKLDRIAIAIYNDVLNEGLKRMHRLNLDKTYQGTLVLYKRLLAKEKRDRKLSKVDKAIKTQFADYLSNTRKAYGFTEYGLHSYVTKPKHWFHDVLGINECQKLATRAYSALWKLHTGEAEKVRFKRKNELISIENKSNISGIRFDRKKMAVIYGNHKFPVIVKKNDEYAQLALLDRVKYAKLQPRMIKGCLRWYVQLVFEGIPPQKNRRCGDSTVQGIDIGVSTIAVSNKNRVIMKELAPECQADARKLRIIERKMDRSKRSTNPQNYNKNGTIRKGRLKWNFSKAYRKLKARRADIYRRMAAKRKASHEQLANEIIASGTDIRVEKMQFNGIQRRAKKTTKNKNGRYKSKKRFGKTIGERAPAMLLSVIERKLKYYGLELKKVDTARVRASQYNPLDESFHRKDLKDRMIELAPDIIVQRDMLSAYILEHTNSDFRSINRTSCREDFDRFLDLQNTEIKRLKENDQLSWYLC